MNRHHYALLIHNSKLIFILRRESQDADDLEVFKPAEWRWSLSQIMDGDWHHYAISVNFPEVRMQTQSRLKELSDQGFHCLLFGQFLSASLLRKQV